MRRIRGNFVTINLAKFNIGEIDQEREELGKRLSSLTSPEVTTYFLLGEICQQSSFGTTQNPVCNL